MERVNEGTHFFPFRLNARHDVLAGKHDGAIGGTAKGDVQGGAILGVVDALAAKHALDPVGNACLCGQFQQQLQGLGIEPLPAEIQPQAFGLHRKQAVSPGLFIHERGDGFAGKHGRTPPERGPGLGAGAVCFSAHCPHLYMLWPVNAIRFDSSDRYEPTR